MNMETRRAKILIVDDTPANVTLLTDLIEINGYLTIQATSGPEALDQLKRDSPDLILLDVRMPKMSGYEVCKQIREQPDTALLPVIMMTAFDPAQERIHGIEAGADDFLTQPINQQELLARVRSLLRVKALHDAVKAHAGELAEWNKKLEVRLSQEAKLAEVARSLADITHEVKNLIMPVVTGTELLEEELKELFAKLPQAERENGRASQNMCKEITEMLTAASQRIQERVKEIGDCVMNLSTPPNFSSCQVTGVIESVLKTLRLVANEKRILLCTEGLGSLPPIRADERRLFNIFGSTQIRMGECCSFSRQEGRQNLEPEILLIPIAIGAPLNHTNLVIQSFDESQLDLVAGRAIRRDAVPVPLDQGGKFLKRPEPLPFELLLPADKKLAGPAFPAIGPELAELLLEQVGGGQSLVGPEQLPKRAAPGQREIGPMGEQRIALALDEGAVLQGHPFVLSPTDLIHRVGQMAQDMERVEQDLCVRRMGLHRVAEGLPHVHHGQPNPGRLLGTQVSKEPVQVGFGSSLPPDPDRASALQVADHDAIRVAFLDRQLIHADHSRSRRRRLGQPGLHVPPVQVLDRVLMQVQQLGDGLVRHVSAQDADVVGKPLRIARILRQPVQPLHFHPLTTRAGHPPLLKRQVETPARRIGIPHAARRAVVEGAVPCPTAGAHGSFFRRMTVISLAWGSPKIPCSRLWARNPGKENNTESVWGCFIGPPGQRPPGVCHRSRTRFEGSSPSIKPSLAAELKGHTRAH